MSKSIFDNFENPKLKENFRFKKQWESLTPERQHEICRYVGYLAVIVGFVGLILFVRSFT